MENFKCRYVTVKPSVPWYFDAGRQTGQTSTDIYKYADSTYVCSCGISLLYRTLFRSFWYVSYIMMFLFFTDACSLVLASLKYFTLLFYILSSGSRSVLLLLLLIFLLLVFIVFYVVVPVVIFRFFFVFVYLFIHLFFSFWFWNNLFLLSWCNER